MITSWDQLPIVMRPEHMAQVLDVVPRTIVRRCNAKRMRPMPDSWEKPYIWCRDRVRAQLEGGTSSLKPPVGRPKKRRRPLQRATEAFAAVRQSTEAPAR